MPSRCGDPFQGGRDCRLFCARVQVSLCCHVPTIRLLLIDGMQPATYTSGMRVRLVEVDVERAQIGNSAGSETEQLVRLREAGPQDFLVFSPDGSKLAAATKVTGCSSMYSFRRQVGQVVL